MRTICTVDATIYRKIVYIFLPFSLMPLLLLCVLISLYAVDIPYRDQWDIIYLFDHYYKGKLTFSDIWKPHNEHRMLFPNCIYLLLGIWTKYNVTYEMGLSVIIALLIFFVHISATLKGKFIHTDIWLKGILFVVFSWLLFSLRQFENFFWGFQLQWFLNILAVASGGFILARGKRSPLRFLGIFSCGIVALYSLSAGAVYWFLVSLFLLFDGYAITEKGGKVYAYFWLLLFFVVMCFYCMGFDFSNNLQQGNFAEVSYLSYVGYVCCYLGASILPQQVTGNGAAPVLCGAAGLIVCSWLVWRSHRRGDPGLRVGRRYFIFLAAYAVGVALLTGAGRFKMGIVQAGASRYTSVSLLLWLAVLFFCADEFGAARVLKKNRFFAGTLAMVLFGMILWGSLGSIPIIRGHLGKMAQLRYRLQHASGSVSPRELTFLHHSSERVQILLPVLKQYDLSIYRK